MGPRADFMANTIPSTPEAIQQAMASFRAIGIDEMVFWPTIPDLNQVDLLAKLVN
jgi:hypothetical protein